MAPDELRALADRIESARCTGIAASWCPIHGDCLCPRNEDGEPESDLNYDGCPLHAPSSSHAAGTLD